MGSTFETGITFNCLTAGGMYPADMLVDWVRIF
jgi:hypothetical protein